MSREEQITRVGEVFRQKRAEMNLSLKEIENATSIRMAYIQAIEAGTIGQLISPVYAKGFVKQYAHFLGLDGDQIVHENQLVFRDPEAQEFAYGIGTLETREGSGSGIKRLPNLLWAAVTVVGLVGAYYLSKYLGVF